MGEGYKLVNNTKKEKISFLHLPVNTKKEISGHPVSAALVSWYLVQNQGDSIQFVSDTYDDWPFESGSKDEMHQYKDVTDEIINDLTNVGILRDDGIAWQDEDEPESVYIRALKNIWIEQ